MVFRHTGMLSNRTDMKCLVLFFFFYFALKLAYLICKKKQGGEVFFYFSLCDFILFGNYLTL